MEYSTTLLIYLSSITLIYLDVAEEILTVLKDRVPPCFSINYFLFAGEGQQVRMYFSRLNASYNMAEIHEQCADLKITKAAALDAEQHRHFTPPPAE